MSRRQLYDTLKLQFQRILEEHDLLTSDITITARGLTPEEAIGHTARKDFPILTGKEIMLMAEFRGSFGQAFTDAPAEFHGTMEKILRMELDKDPHARGLFIASLNAVMGYLKLADNTVHCKNNGPEFCAEHMVQWICANYGDPKVALIGFQPALIHALSQHFELRVLDLNPANIGKKVDGVLICNGETSRKRAIEWADLILCTGSTLSNGTIVNYLQIQKPVVFFGTTLSGAAPLLGLKRACFADLSYAQD